MRSKDSVLLSLVGWGNLLDSLLHSIDSMPYLGLLRSKERFLFPIEVQVQVLVHD
jgi:hypothetical protein